MQLGGTTSRCGPRIVGASEDIASYGDLRAPLGANAAAGFDHYPYAGACEGKVATFGGLEYIASYRDLIAPSGNQ